jgi:predicted enzyme related to lactoylglutathione lyase
MAPDRKRAMEFYRALFGWDFVEGPEETGFYTTALLDGRRVAGVGGPPPGAESMPSLWTTYLAVSDVDKTAEAITEAGGQVLASPMDVLTEGRMAIAADPAGAVFGLWQAGRHSGMEVANIPGTVTWNEGMSHDFEAAKNFYSKVFGYGFDDMSGPDFSYAVLTVGGNIVGGLGALPADSPAEVPPHWGTYFAVADTDAAVDKVVELGGTVLTPPFDSPHGRIGIVTDNQGTPFRVITSG